MNQLPPVRLPETVYGQQPAANELSDAVIEAAVDQAIEKAKRHDTTPQAVIGNTPPVPQPDMRVAPQWAVGVAVASIGVGAGSTGLGCAAWLLFKGLSMVSVPGLERFAWIIIAPFAGAAMLATAVGGLISKARKAAAPEIHNHNGPEYHEHQTTSTRAVWAKTVNKQ